MNKWVDGQKEGRGKRRRQTQLMPEEVGYGCVAVILLLRYSAKVSVPSLTLQNAACNTKHEHVPEYEIARVTVSFIKIHE